MSYLEEIKRKYDITDHKEARVEIPELPTDGIVLIVGTSGSGKSTILRSLGEFKTPTVYPGTNVITIDEFTSVVDRDTAKSLALSIRKFYDRRGTADPLYIASCHRDIVEWLDPDYVYDTDLCVLENRRSPFRLGSRPELTLTIQSTSVDYWQYFKKYHYLDTAISKSAHYYVLLLGDKPIGFHAAIHSTNRDIHSYWRGHRTVILPEFQGMGIGTAFSDAIAEMYVSRGLRYFSKTAHPSFGEHREKSPLWRPTSMNRKSRVGSYLNKDGTARKMAGYGGTTTVRDAYRVCYSHEYIGKKPKLDP